MTIDINELRRLALDGELAAMQEIILRLEAAESARRDDYQNWMTALDRNAELLAKLEAAETERDALRSLVVMRFDHAHPPQFTQGYDTHELLEPVTAEHCRWFVAEITRLRAKIEQMERQEPVAFGLYSGWALKATYLKEHEACEQRDRRQLTADLGGSLEAYRVAPLYALPGAQAQNVPKAVAYLDLGVGGYMDIGTEFTDEELATLPKGRHMLGIVGTYGVDGYVPVQSVPSELIVTPKMEQAFHEKVEITTVGSIRGLADGIKAALLAAAPDREAKP